MGGVFSTANNVANPRIARWLGPDMPAITEHPESVEVDDGQPATFTVAAAAHAGDVTYQWRRDGVPLDDKHAHISGVDEPTLMIAPAGEDDAGEYDVIIMHECDKLLSDAAQLVVNGVGGGCSADLNNDDVVDVLDMLALFAAWGDNPGHPADLNGDDVVDVLDMLMLFAAWGECP